MIKSIITMETKQGRDALSAVCIPVEDKYLAQEVVKNLVDTVNEFNQLSIKNDGKILAVGLAANQIGEFIRVFIIKWGTIWLPIVNPVIVGRSEKKKTHFEGCISRPNMERVRTSRSTTITLEYQCPITGDLQKKKFKGRDAVVVQHEINHLDGILI